MTDQPATPEGTRPWPAMSPVRRYGPIALVLALLVGVGVVATVNGQDGTVTTERNGPSVEEVSTYADDPRLPVYHSAAAEAGTLDDHDWGDHCDTDLGRLAIPSVYAPPCVPAWDGGEPWVNRSGETVEDNGGATANGVTEDTIKVVYYIPGEADLISSMQAFGIFDTTEVAVQGLQELVEMSNELYETYGRRVELIAYQATGDGKEPGPAQADAVAVAEDIGAFASINGPTQTSAYQDELARQGVLCIQCGFSTTDATYAKNAPHAWGYLPSPDQLLFGVFDFGVANLHGKPAEFAGDPAMRDQIREWGIVHYEQDPPVYGDLKEAAEARYEAQGASAKVTISYILDQATLQTQAQAIVGRLKREGVTSVVFLGDPLMPMYLTQQATLQDYHPEWLITGTVFTDATATGRLADQEQWAHAFGASALPARAAPELSPSWRLYEWWYGEDPEAEKTLPLYGPVVQMLFLGIHMAGPELTAETFAGGLFSYPPSGGGPTTPRISFGLQGVFEEVDYVGVDDFTYVWWNAEVEGPDEQNTEGVGMWTYTFGGERLLLGEVPEVDTDVLFDPAEGVTIFDEIPEEDQTPDYDPWPTAPSPGGG